MVFFAPVVTAFVVLPFSPYLTAGALGTGLIFYVALSSIDVIGVFMAGWGSNNKYALIGGLRSAAQMISYELPLVLALVGAVMLTSVLSRRLLLATLPIYHLRRRLDLLQPDRRRPDAPRIPWLWFFLLQPLGLLVYYICGLAETNRSPFDLPEAESELVAGYLTEYSRPALGDVLPRRVRQHGIVSAVATAIFLGGWSGPGAAIGFWNGLLGGFWGGLVFNIIAAFWFIVKMSFFLFIFLWVRATLPRLRADQLMRFAWLFLIPLTLVNILLTGALLLLPLDTPIRIAIAAVVNWLLLIGVVFSLRGITGVKATGRLPRWLRTQRRTPQPAPQPGVSPERAPAGAGAGNRR